MPSIKDKIKKDEAEKDVKENTSAEKSYVTKEELNSFGEKLFMQITDLFKKKTHVHGDLIGKDAPIPGNEIGKDTRGVEPVSAFRYKDEAKLESFMNERLIIYVHPSPNKEDNPIIVPNVNGINQPIIRGQKCSIKRKYVEALARNRITRYEQKVPNPSEPHKYIMQPDTVVKDPFTVHHDPNPAGGDWLKAILSEKAA